MSRTGSINRADLIEALRLLDEETQATAAELLGYTRRPPRKSRLAGTKKRFDSGNLHDDLFESVPQTKIIAKSQLPAAFWRLERYEVRDRSEHERVPPETKPVWRNRPSSPPPFHWLESWRNLGPRLFDALKHEGQGIDFDIEGAVKILSRGENLDHMPRLAKPRPALKLQIIFDRSAHLMPYWDDQDIVAATLAEILGNDCVERAFVRETADEIILEHIDGGNIYRPLPPGASVLVLGDLSCLLGSPYREKSWRKFGRRALIAGCRPLALVPAPTDLVHPAMRRIWQILPWQRSRIATINRDDRLKTARELLAYLSYAYRIEPGLLRAARLVLGLKGSDAGTEAEAWNYLDRQHPTAGTLAPRLARELQEEFAAELCPQRMQAVLALQMAWRYGVADEIWFDEIINLPPELQSVLPCLEDVEQARDFFAFAFGLHESGGELGAKMASWLANKVEPRATCHGKACTEFARAIALARKDDPDFDFGSLDTLDIPAGPEEFGTCRFQLNETGFEIRPADERSRSGNSHLGVLPSKNGIVNYVALPDPNQDSALFWLEKRPPEWASGWGVDGFGPYSEFTIGEVVQRMRWISPGQFLMGSPKDEAGRYDDEGPQHEVRLENGFWMMDTPVRQCLWEAVMDDNPSEFKSPDRPVDSVDYEMASAFLIRLNEHLPGLDLSLPSEAQWEYACRAGTDTATYVGDLEILGENNAPVLDGIAWYGGNSGIGFELENGKDSSDWPEKQYPDSSSGTHPVARKRPNGNGLFDMLGNVWELCADHWHDDYDGTPADGSAWLTDDAPVGRVIRGGAWNDPARHVRAACRSGLHPVYRGVDVGFRCVRVQASDKREASPVEREAAREAERGAAARTTGDAEGAINLKDTAQDNIIELKSVSRMRVFSDCAILDFAPIGRPHWANQMGCDRFGLFAEFKVEDVVQRMRWIPPGQFLMGSPKDEEGRSQNEGPPHEVRLVNGFWMMDTPVRQCLWEVVMGDNPSQFKEAECPVETVSFKNASEFLFRLNELISGLELALPSEAQWEYACRAGTMGAIYAGAGNVLDDLAWYSANSEKKIRPVGLKRANAYGLYDMLGNVWEICTDHWHANFDGAPVDGSAWLTDDATVYRVMRGGAWNNSAGYVRAACRGHLLPEDRLGDVGFRCVRVQS